MDEYEIAVEIISILTNNGYRAYFVGGWVRDMLIGNKYKDIDIATNASIENIRFIFPQIKIIGEKYNVCNIFHI